MKNSLKKLKKEIEKIPLLRSHHGSHLKDLPLIQAFMGKHSEKSKKNLKEDVMTPENLKANNDDHEKHKQLHKEMGQHYAIHDHEDDARILHYTDESQDLNHYLHKKEQLKQKGEEYHSQHYEDYSKGLQKALMKHKTPHELTVYSGLRYSPEDLFDKYGKRKGSHVVVNHPAFLSTSISKHIANKFSKHDPYSDYISRKTAGQDRSHHMLKIHIPKGHPGAYIAHRSFVPNEKEFLLPHHTKLSIERTPEHDSEAGTYVWHAHVLPHEEDHD